MKRFRAALLIAAGLAANPAHAADEFKLEPVTSVASVPVEQLKPRVIVFSETRLGDKADSPAELIPFDEWLRDKPVQRRFLAMLPDFREPLLKEGGTAKLSMYVAEARFRVPKPAQAFDLKRYASIAFLEGLDPAVKHTRNHGRRRDPEQGRGFGEHASDGPQMVRGRGRLLPVALSFRGPHSDRHSAGQQAARRNQEADPGFHRIPERDPAAVAAGPAIRRSAHV